MIVMKLDIIVARAKHFLHAAYGIDARSLALFRVSVGIVVLIDLIRRFQHSTALYSDVGVSPRSAAISSVSQFRWSVLFTSGSPHFVNALFVLGFLAAFAMILGWRTRVATVILWVIVISLQTRNYHLNSGADTLIRVTLFWAMLLPLGMKWSLDRYFSREEGTVSEARRQPSIVASVATFGLILQTACVYLFTAIKKDGPRWREEGSALYYALGARDVSSGLGTWIFHNVSETILTALTYGTLLLEYAVPIMLVLPLRSGWLRTVGVLLILTLQLGIVSTMMVGLFPAISIAIIFGILPTWFWDNLASRVPLRFASANLRQKLTRLLGPVQTLIPQRQASGATLVYPNTASTTSAGRESRNLGFVNPVIGNRPPWPAMFGNVIATIAIVVVLAWNVQTVSSYQVPQSLRPIAISTGLYQNWSMFAPGPQTASIWFVVEGELESGDKVDLLMPIFKDDVSLQQPVVWDQSNDIVLQDKYWRKYFNSIRGRDADSLRFAAYSCRTWNAENTGDDRLARVTLTRGLASTLPDGMRGEPVFSQLGSWNCG